jgi:tRNA threonylcarbamoyladenosine biosynthesis protein TsaB
MPSRYILCIETATEVCSVAIADSGKVIAEKTLSEANVHGSLLTVFIEEALKSAGIQFKNLSAVAYSCGPGSYTGLRIGLSVAKGICYGSDLPLIEVQTLQHMVSELNKFDYYFPMIDARRMEVYGALLNADHEFLLNPFACIVDAYLWDNLLNDKKICFLGNGMHKSRNILNRFPNAFFLSDYALSAATMAAIADKKFNEKEWADLAYSVPFYLKEANVTEAKKKSI